MDEQTKRVWRRLKFEGDESARDELVLMHLPLVRYVLGRLPITLPSGLSRDDLASAGVLALMRAIDHFDPERGLAFTTFAVPHIRGAMFDELRAHDIVPRSVRQRANAIERAYIELERQGQASPSLEEVGEKVDLKPREIERTMDAVGLNSLLSLDAMVRKGAGGREQRILEGAADRSTVSPLAALMAKERKDILARAIAALPEPDRRVITLYYQRDLMLTEIAQVLSVTKSRVSQIHSRALFRLRSFIASATAAHSANQVEGRS